MTKMFQQLSETIKLNHNIRNASHHFHSLQHFYAEPRAAKEILGWKSTTNLPEDLKERFAEYVSIGRDKKEINFEVDDKIVDSLNKYARSVTV